MMSREKWSSEPDLHLHKTSQEPEKGKGKNWISRHLSFKRKRRGGGGGGGGKNEEDEGLVPLTEGGRSNSSPILSITDFSTEPSPPSSPQPPRRPSCIDGVVAINIIPKYRAAKEAAKEKSQNVNTVVEEEEEATKIEPPQILKTDFDEEND